MEQNISVTIMGAKAFYISDSVYNTLGIIFQAGLNPPLAVASIIANALNVLVFWKMGIKDGVTATFFTLAIADMCTSVISLFGFINALLRTHGPLSVQITAGTLYGLFLFIVIIPMYVSMFATTVISVVRCCSVAMPFQVKSILTTRRQLVAILLPSLTALITVLYVLVSVCSVIFYFDPRSNTTQLSSKLVPNYRVYVNILDEYRNVTFYACMITVLVCLVVLTRAMKKSSQFRTSATGTVAQDKAATVTTDGGAETKSESHAQSNAKRREKQVIKTVALVAAVFILCSLPTLLQAIIRIVEPEYRGAGIYSRGWTVNLMVVECSVQVNTLINIFIFLSTNTRYKKIFWAMFLSKERRP